MNIFFIKNHTINKKKNNKYNLSNKNIIIFRIIMWNIQRILSSDYNISL